MTTRRGLPDPNRAGAAASIVGTLYESPPEAPAPPTPPPRAKLTVQVAGDVVSELRDAVVYLLSQGQRATVAAVTEQALRRELERLRDEHHDGRCFPARTAGPPPGRPIV